MAIQSDQQQRYDDAAKEPETRSSLGQPIKLEKAYYDEVIASAVRFKKQPGFGIRLIKISAQNVFKKHILIFLWMVIGFLRMHGVIGFCIHK